MMERRKKMYIAPYAEPYDLPESNGVALGSGDNIVEPDPDD